MPASLLQLLPGSLGVSLFLDPKYCISAEKNDSTVRMKEFTAGSKAKTVQLADFKCLVCPLDDQIEKLLPRYNVCVCRGAPGIPQAPVSAWHWVPSLQTTEEGGPSPSEVKVTQSCPTLCDPMDCRPSGSSIHGIL